MRSKIAINIAMYYTAYRFLMANNWVEIPINSFIGFDIALIYFSKMFIEIIFESKFFIAINIDTKTNPNIYFNKIFSIPD